MHILSSNNSSFVCSDDLRLQSIHLHVSCITYYICSLGVHFPCFCVIALNALNDPCRYARPVQCAGYLSTEVLPVPTTVTEGGKTDDVTHSHIIQTRTAKSNWERHTARGMLHKVNVWKVLYKKKKRTFGIKPNIIVPVTPCSENCLCLPPGVTDDSDHLWLRIIFSDECASITFTWHNFLI